MISPSGSSGTRKVRTWNGPNSALERALDERQPHFGVSRGAAGLDRSHDDVRRAVVAGILAALDRRHQHGLPAVVCEAETPGQRALVEGLELRAHRLAEHGGPSGRLRGCASRPRAG